MVEWLMAPVLKTGRAQALVGSNPTPSASYKQCEPPAPTSRTALTKLRRFERSSTADAKRFVRREAQSRGAEAKLWQSHPLRIV